MEHRCRDCWYCCQTDKAGGNEFHCFFYRAALSRKTVMRPTKCDKFTRAIKAQVGMFERDESQT